VVPGTLTQPRKGNTVNMNILFTSAEAAPFAKVGGLGDVVGAGSLPKALRDYGLDARVILPLYGKIDRTRFNIKPLFSFEFPRKTGNMYVHIHATNWNGVPFYFVESYPYFGHGGSIYTEWAWDVPRYIFFSQVAMAVAWELRQREGWAVDVMHINDWHTGLVAFLLQQSRHLPEWADVRSMITIHNMAHQGARAGGWLWELGIAGREDQRLRQAGLTDNLLAIGIAYSDYVTTVSPRHAEEIQYPYLGYKLAGLVRSRTYKNELYGVLNGIDTETYNPQTDQHIIQNFHASNTTTHRVANKRQLQADANLPQRDEVPIIGLVSRLVAQKGIDLAVPALQQLLREEDMQVVALGTGNPGLSHQLWQLSEQFPGKVRTYITYDGALAQRIYAGCDMFLMPSRYEPCGIGQMIAMRYGALPIVRETGGLADTVENYDNGVGEIGTGFVFLWEEVQALVNTLRWALTTYRQRPEVWRRMQQRAMARDVSWERSARIYEKLYRGILH
jgi:starch synthase